MYVHMLKVLPEPFEAILADLKRFEYRRNDRDFEVGEILCLCEYNDSNYTGRELYARIDYALYGPSYGIPEGFCVMSITRVNYVI